MIRRIQPHLEKPVYLLFFLSGACGLVYEVIWGKYLSLFIGNTTQAHMIVLATFMGGLAAGSFLFDLRKMSEHAWPCSTSSIVSVLWRERSLLVFMSWSNGGSS